MPPMQRIDEVHAPGRQPLMQGAGTPERHFSFQKQSPESPSSLMNSMRTGSFHLNQVDVKSTAEGVQLNLPWLQAPSVEERRKAMGLNEPALASFIEDCAFVSLGCCCLSAYGLQALGLRKAAYPFDWVRAPVSGIIQCFNERFEKFFHTTGPGWDDMQTKCRVFSTVWGGSFWHHDPTSPDCQHTFRRRIDRLSGSKDASASTSRVFVWTPNSSAELYYVGELYQSLKDYLPKEANVYLLVMVDNQSVIGPVHVANSTSKIIIYRLPQSVWSDPQNWSQEHTSVTYADAIASALRTWCSKTREQLYGRGSPNESLSTDLQQLSYPSVEYPDLNMLVTALDQFDGGSTITANYYPRKCNFIQVPLDDYESGDDIGDIPSPLKSDLMNLTSDTADYHHDDAQSLWSSGSESEDQNGDYWGGFFSFQSCLAEHPRRNSGYRTTESEDVLE